MNHLHPEYIAHAAAWKRSRDVLAGEDAVKAAGEVYLPRLDSQSETEYAAYGWAGTDADYAQLSAVACFRLAGH